MSRKAQWDESPAGLYVFMSDHSIPPSVKVSDYEYMLELFWENCRY